MDHQLDVGRVGLGQRCLDRGQLLVVLDVDDPAHGRHDGEGRGRRAVEVVGHAVGDQRHGPRAVRRPVDGVQLGLVEREGALLRDHEAALVPQAPGELGVLATPAAEALVEPTHALEEPARDRQVRRRRRAEALVAQGQPAGAAVDQRAPVIGRHQPLAGLDPGEADQVGRTLGDGGRVEVGRVDVPARPDDRHVRRAPVPPGVARHEVRDRDAVRVEKQQDGVAGLAHSEVACPGRPVAAAVLAEQPHVEPVGHAVDDPGDVLGGPVVGHHDLEGGPHLGREPREGPRQQFRAFVHGDHDRDPDLLLWVRGRDTVVVVGGRRRDGCVHAGSSGLQSASGWSALRTR